MFPKELLLEDTLPEGTPTTVLPVPLGCGNREDPDDAVPGEFDFLSVGGLYCVREVGFPLVSVENLPRCYKRIPETGSFTKKRGFFGSRFCSLYKKVWCQHLLLGRASGSLQSWQRGSVASMSHGKRVSKRQTGENSHTDGGNVKWYNHFGK